MKKTQGEPRINFILFLIFIIGAAIISRLFFLQIINHKFYQAQALGSQAGFSEVLGNRGEIFSENSQESNGKNGSGEIKSLAINRDSQNNSKERYYPQENMASQVLGFLGGEKIGQYGIEGYYEDILKGKSGIKEEKKGLDLIFSDNNKESLDGSDLYLTIDYNIQFQAESLLKKAEDDFDIDSGQIIVLKPDSGRILALANFPSFNSNQYSKQENFDIFQNSVTQKLFEPGSVLKPFTMAIALNEGKITPDTKFTDKGFVKVGIETIWNFDRQKYGEQTMTGVLEKSINTGAVFASQQVSHKTYLNYIDKFGFNQKTGVDLQSEVYSSNENLRKAQDVGFATASFGQGIEITPMQIVKGFSVFANAGKTAKPYIVEKVIKDGQETYAKPQFSEQIISQQTVSQITTMLVSVVEKGFGSGAKIPGYYLAGKTGTAQVPLKNGKGYDLSKTIQSFVGYGPAFNPQFLILVKLDNPKNTFSNISAAPVFKKLAQYIINYWQIPPDYQ